MLRRTFGDQAVDDTLARARARGSHAMVESTHEIADEKVASSEDASRARNRIGTRQWAAAAYERGTFGNRAGAPVVNVNIGMLHLDAIRKRTIEHVEVNMPDRQLTDGQTVDAELVDPALDDVREGDATS